MGTNSRAQLVQGLLPIYSSPWLVLFNTSNCTMVIRKIEESYAGYYMLLKLFITA